MARARTLSFAVAALGLIAVATPASAAEDRKEVKTRVKIIGVHSEIVSPEFGAPYAVYWVEGEVRSPRAGCRNGRIARLIHHPADPHANPPRGRYGHFFLLWREHTFPLTEERDRVKVTRSSPPPGPGRKDFDCEGDRSRRFTIPPPS